MVTEADVFPAALTCLRDQDEYVRKNVTTLMREVVKHTPEVIHNKHKQTQAQKYTAGHKVIYDCVWLQLSQLIVNCGGLGAVIDCLGNCSGSQRLPGIMMLGYVAAHSENLAMAVILSKVCVCTCFINLHSLCQSEPLIIKCLDGLGPLHLSGPLFFVL